MNKASQTGKTATFLNQALNKKDDIKSRYSTISGTFIHLRLTLSLSSKSSAHRLIDPISELANTSKHRISLGRRASWGTPADSTLQNPVPSGSLTNVRTTTVSMAAT